MKVSPLPSSVNEIVELRPKRRLRIRHINPRSRDEGFQKELKIYFDNIKSAATTPRVVTVPRLNANRHVELTREVITDRSEINHGFQNPENLPNMTTNSNGHPKSNALSGNNLKLKANELVVTTHDDRPLSNKQSSDLHSESRASVISTGDRSVMSASNVHVAMEKKHVATPSIIAEEPLSSRSSHSITMQNGLPSSRINSPLKNNKSDQCQNTELFQKPIMSSLSPRKSESSMDPLPILKNNHATNVKLLADTDLVLFFIHGVGGSSDIWNAQIEYFDKLKCEIICLDLIGHGMSDAPDNKAAYTFDEILFDVQELFDRFCKRKNIVIGHSYGCAFATVLARERRKWVSKLVLVSGGGPTPLAPQPGIFSLPLCLLACCRPCVNSGFQRGAFNPRFKNKLKRQIAFDIPSYVLSYTMNGQYWPDGDDLYHSFITVPTLLVYGKKDGLVDLEEEEEMMKAIYGSHLEVIEDAGHMVMMEASDTFNQLLYNFITDQPLETLLTSTDQITHMVDTDDEHLHTATHRTMKSEASLHSIRSCKSTKSMPHGLLTSSFK